MNEFKIVVVQWKDEEGETRTSEVREDYFEDDWKEDNNATDVKVIGKKDNFGKQFR